MKNLSIEYRDGKFIQLVIDGVVMKDVTSIEFSHKVGQDVPTLSVSGHLLPELVKNTPALQQVEKDSA